MLKFLRKGLLLYILLIVAGVHWLSVKRTTSWEQTLWVVIHPINGDGSVRSSEYIASLPNDAFDVINKFITEEAKHYKLPIARPMKFALGAPISEQPPLPPREGSTFSLMLWSLKLRYWAWQVDKGPNSGPRDINVFVRYFDPETSPHLAHSLGLQKGLIGVVNAFATRTQAGSNKFIIAHEVLHTLGATDKYDPITGQPIYPDGYADADVDPLYPQKLAEVMGGRIPIQPTESRIPKSLNSVVVGIATAKEIGWR